MLTQSQIEKLQARYALNKLVKSEMRRNAYLDGEGQYDCSCPAEEFDYLDCGTRGDLTGDYSYLDEE